MRASNAYRRGMDQASTRAERPTSRRLSPRGIAETRWTRLPIARAHQLSPQLEMPTYCQTLRCQTKRRTATTLHALINGTGELDCAWVACADCTGLMMEGAFAS